MTLRRKARVITYKMLPTKFYLKVGYAYMYHRILNLKKPKRLSEKWYWLKLYYKKYNYDLIRKCYDKYNVREYVSNKVGEKYLTKVFGVFDNAEEIDMSVLPQKFVLKVTQSSGYNIICNNKCLLKGEEVKKRLNDWLRETNSVKKQNEHEESYYYTGNAKIICEEYLETNEGKIVEDYKFFCFNGKVKFIYTTINSVNDDGEKKEDYFINVYDIDWNLIPMKWGSDHDYNPNIIVEKPDKLNEMILLAEKLSEDFPFVRVDLYYNGNAIYFGELTWTPTGGNSFVKEPYYDKKFGELLKLPNVKV